MSIYHLAEIRHRSLGWYSYWKFSGGGDWGEGSFHYIKEIAATLVLQLRNQGGLNQITSLFLFLFLLPVLLLLLVGFGSNFILKEFFQGILERVCRFLKDVLTCSLFDPDMEKVSILPRTHFVNNLNFRN